MAEYSDALVQWFNNQKQSLAVQARMLESGTLETHEKRDGKVVDTSAATLVEVRRKLLEIEQFLEANS